MLQKQQQQDEKQEEKQTQTCDNKIRGKMVTTCGMTKPGYGAGRSAALSAFLNVDNLCGSHVPLDISVILL